MSASNPYAHDRSLADVFAIVLVLFFATLYAYAKFGSSEATPPITDLAQHSQKYGSGLLSDVNATYYFGDNLVIQFDYNDQDQGILTFSGLDAETCAEVLQDLAVNGFKVRFSGDSEYASLKRNDVQQSVCQKALDGNRIEIQIHSDKETAQ